MKLPKTNRQILVEIFWEHCQFGWSDASVISNHSTFYRSYRQLLVTLTKAAVTSMSNDVEKTIVRKLLVSRYGHELVPSEVELAFPNESYASVGDLWEPAFGILSELYGRQVGTARRTGKDLVRYSRQKGVFAQTLEFGNLQSLGATALVRNSSVWQRLVFQEFPREHLYRLEGEAVCVEFDDWPGCWIRNWGGNSLQKEDLMSED